MKKIAIGLGSVVVLLVAMMVIIPLVVDVDKYRPEIVRVANENINGKLELGKLKLSLWGQIKVEVDGVVLSDSKNRKVVSVKNAFFHIPFTSIFGGSPSLTFKMENPEIAVLKDAQGKLNVMSLMKVTTPATGAGSPPAAGAAPQNPAANAAASSGKPMVLPAMATQARLGIELLHAQLSYHDDVAKMDSQVKDLNVILKDISLSRPIELEIMANLSTKMAGFDLAGPAKINGLAQATLKDGAFSEASLMLNANFDNVAISVPGVFEKKEGIPANGKIALKASAKDFTLQEVKVKFHNAEITVTGNGQLGSPTPEKTTVKIDVSSNVIELAPWAELIIPLRAFALGGSVQFKADVSGPTDQFKYGALLEAKNITAKAPMLKHQPKFEALIKVATDQIEQIHFSMEAPGNDLRVNGNLVSFAAPKIHFAVASNGMDLDQLIDFPPPPKKEAGAAAPAAGGEAGKGAAAAKAPAADLDAMLDPMRKNPMLAATQLAVDLNMKSLQAYGVKITDINGRFTFKDLVAALEKFSMNVFSGSIKSSFSANLKPKAPAYSFGANVSGLDLQAAVTSQMQLMKNTLTGKANFDINGSGSSFNTDPAIKNLNAKGNFKIAQARFSTVDIGKMVGEASEKGIEKAGDKVPMLKGKSLKGKLNKDSKYELVSSDFSISGGKFSAPNFYAKADKNAGVDLKGNTSANLIDQTVDAHWEVIDTYNLTGAKDISIEQMGTKIDHVLCEGNQPFRFPVTAKGPMVKPEFDYKEIPEFLGKIALANITKGASGKAKAAVVNKAVDAIKKQAPAPVQNQLDNLKKKFKF